MANYYCYQRKGAGTRHYHRSGYVGSIYDGEKDDAKTFKHEEVFYYVNFLDSDGDFNSKHSVMVEGKTHALNLARWYVNNLWALRDIPYYVCKVGVYDSHKGHICSYRV